MSPLKRPAVVGGASVAVAANSANGDGMTGAILVPIASTRTLGPTISHVMETATAESTIHLVRTVSGHQFRGRTEKETALIEQAETAAREQSDAHQIETAVLGGRQYVAGSEAHVRRLRSYMEEHGISRVILDPNYTPDATAAALQTIAAKLTEAGYDVETAPVTADSRLPTREEFIRAGTIGVVAFLFYILLGGPTYPFALGSGVITGLLAAVFLRNVAFETTPNIRSGLKATVRSVRFALYLLWEIIKANIQFAYVVLHPSLPIDPRVDRIDAAVDSGQAVTAFGNSITLTPGTLTVDADNNRLIVHSLNQSAHDDLVEGVHERPVRYLFYGRDAALSYPSPAARDDVTPIIGPDASSGGETDE